MLVRNNKLKNLNVENCEISDNTCKLIAAGLAQNKHLEVLNLSGNRVCGSGIVALFQVLEDNVCKLCDLNLSFNKVYPQLDVVRRNDVLGKKFLGKNRSLKVLAVSDFAPFCKWFGVELFKGLECNTTLTELDISGNYLDQDEDTLSAFVDMIAKNESITTLNVKYCQRDESLAKAIVKSSSLRKVIVEHLVEDHYELLCQRSQINVEVSLSDFD